MEINHPAILSGSLFMETHMWHGNEIKLRQYLGEGQWTLLVDGHEARAMT